jgi:hypothetical protein
MAKEQVDTCTKVLGRVYSVLKQKVLYLLLLVKRVTGLNAVTTAVLIAHAVKLAALLATLLKKATDGYAAKVLSITIPVRDLQPPEL